MQQQNETKSSEFDFKFILFKYIALWPYLVAAIVLAFSGGFWYLRYTHPIFSASASIIVQDEKKGGSAIDNPILKELNIAGASKLVENEIEVLKSYDLMESAVRRLGLAQEIQSVGRVTQRVLFGKQVPFVLEIANPDTVAKPVVWSITTTGTGWYTVENDANGRIDTLRNNNWYLQDGIRFRFAVNPNFKQTKTPNQSNEYDISLLPLAPTVQKYLSRLAVIATNRSASVIKLSIKDENELRAVAVLDAIIQNYYAQQLEEKNQLTANTLGFVSDRLNLIESELKGVEAQVQNYKTRNRITDISSEAQQIIQTATEVDRNKAAQRTQLSIVEELEQTLLVNQNNPKLVPSTLGIEEASLMSLIARHNELVQERERALAVSSDRNPKVRELAGQINVVRESLLGNIQNLKKAYQLSLSEVSRQDAVLNSRIRNIPLLEQGLVQITRDRNVKEQIYMFLLQKREESAITLASNIIESRTIEKPRPLGLIAPKAKMVWLICLLTGLLLPALIFAISELLNNRIQDLDEINRRSNAPALGGLAYIPKLDSPLVISSNSREMIAEQLRTIRTNIGLTGQNREQMVILISSHQPGEGKSFTSLNLAASYALLDKKVVILELDLRKPKILKELGLSSTPGIASILAGSVSPDAAGLTIDLKGYQGNLHLLPSGPIPPNPAELISSKRMEQMMQHLRNAYDMIIIDSPPFSLVTDASLLQRYADMTILVLRQGYSVRAAFDAINHYTAGFPDKSIYVLLNGIKRTSGYAGKYGYGYGYGGYGYVYANAYYSEDKPQKRK